MNLNLSILQNEQASLPQFINFWSKFYNYPKEELYAKIDQPQFTEKDINDLYEWKNGMSLSGAKLGSLNKKVIAKIDTINQLKKSQKIDISAFLLEFEELSFVWRIFLLHIIKPQKYPIYDQNIHRCFNFIHTREHRKITNTISEKSKEQFYFEDYLPFIETLNGIPLRKIDRAFFTFGQFLSAKNFQLILE
ncbi:MAG: hypothetical protein A2W90_08330 [Bacteroidetes bacterium GWF2_42_66]|nr:MAG: hypothetical protein A2W92_15105 [Bacteroidetes bacterium GWA2_42_15]OFX96480.1 MAG: hypothetical protein A2W89_05990 [Bacteroidetes bacterium GWE2_42_39]OFY40900.1 MAG: hypothetical protein A2W90_08330 [Bacteroidetes bacterium GWF2_42_66]HBL76331.1 hypothetical protein [Prolixibacteraceae bacterium]HCR92115.1 hypothetical protein [Prolixibacteraceae bacterium]